MKVLLRFDLPEDKEEYEDAMNGSRYKCQLDDVWNNVFRPSRKHGYSNTRLNELLDKPDGRELMELLIDLYQETVTGEI